ncbi:hypothetical protein KFL_007630010 [Klebsormidium nitens]|uniref:CCHC-type domain-containing protein n=1 Tax=Klebsormidium nitens TaxID=105231 RepID=A0A1Y1IKD0_KLENI|nr:hypothetical protein KFL_007630010 [Klebsormidium nitens]|eukprot:GAQ91310.1 hypothetical protein KFL_007630010 [Klebsormidium nitens]
MELTLDAVQPELMQKKEQRLKLEAEMGTPEGRDEENMPASAFVVKRERYGVTVAKGSSERGVTGGGGGNTRTCYACDEKGHVRAYCRNSNAECFKCGERGTLARCVESPGLVQRAAVRTAGSGKGLPVCVYGVAQGGADAGGDCDNNRRAFLAVKGTANVERKIGVAARKPPVVAKRKRVEVKPVNFIEVDVESDDESDDGLKETQPVGVSVGETEAPTEPVTEVRGATKTVGATAAEAVRARMVPGTVLVESEGATSPGTGDKRYPESARAAPVRYGGGEANEGWVTVTPKAKKKRGRRG